MQNALFDTFKSIMISQLIIKLSSPSPLACIYPVPAGICHLEVPVIHRAGIILIQSC